MQPLVFPINDKSSGTYTAQITGNDGVTPLPGAVLTTLTLTLYVTVAAGTDTFVNGRNHQNVLNQNNVTVDAGGNLVWAVQVADTTLVESPPFEQHVALFEWTWPGGSGKHQVILLVQNIRQVL